jgi:hypothetical protein
MLAKDPKITLKRKAKQVKNEKPGKVSQHEKKLQAVLTIL